MFHYVYQITNLVNGKIYVGKRSSKVDPKDDPYMGSGKLIKAAIKKYGVECFSKDILGIFDTDSKAFKFEEQIVTPNFLLREDVYNLHSGGTGGFEHINSDPIKRAEVSEKSRQSNIATGRGGTKNWTEEGWKRVREQSFGERIKRGEFDTNNWEKLPEERKQELRRLASERQTEKNKLYGWFVNNLGQRKRFLKCEVPEGWITTTEFNENRMKNSKRWYNDGKKNFYLVLPNPLIDELGLVKGRIKTA